MSPFEYDEDYYFRTNESLEDNRQFVLVIYDIVSNKRRVKFARFMEGYGFRVQKSCFEAYLSDSAYRKLVGEIPDYIKKEEDSVRLYKIYGSGQVQSWGQEHEADVENEEIIVI